MSIEIDIDASRHARQRLHAYLSREVDSGCELVCESADECARSVGSSRFAGGQLSHVGRFYGLSLNRKPLRILVVPMQTGRDDVHVSVADRGRQVETAKPLGARPMPRTPHMDGTALALHVLLGLAESGPDEFHIGSQAAHVYDCFAMANCTLCSRVGEGASGSGTRTMIRNCRAHLSKTIELLAPTVILSQGWTATGDSPSSIVAELLGVSKPGPWTCTMVNRTAGRTAFVTAYHPSRYWSTTKHKFWPKVRAALLQARHETTEC